VRFFWLSLCILASDKAANCKLMKIDQIGICTRDHDTLDNSMSTTLASEQLAMLREKSLEGILLSQVDPIVSSKCGILPLLQVPRRLCHPDSIRGIHNRSHPSQSQLTSRCKRRERVLWCPNSKQMLILGGTICAERTAIVKAVVSRPCELY
jgi:hypothetical protein